MFELDDLIDILAKKYSLKRVTAERLARIQFRFLAEKISTGEFKTVKFIHLGKFTPIPKRKVYWENKRNEDNTYSNQSNNNKAEEENINKEYGSEENV